MATGDEMNRQILDMMSVMMSKMDTLSDQVTNLGQRMSAVERSIGQAHNDIAALTCFGHPYNMMFYNLPTKQGMSEIDNFRRFLLETLQLEADRANVMPLCVQRIGRLTPADVHLPLCVSFVSTKDVEAVREKAMAHGAKLKRSGMAARWLPHDGAYLIKTY